MTGPASSASSPPPLAHAEPAMGTVFSFAVLSGAHYVFFVSKLVNEDRRSEGSTLNQS